MEEPQVSMHNADGLLYIYNASSKQIVLNIFNMLGATVKEMSVQQGESRVEIDLPQGLYLATSTIEGRVFALKFVR
jgi:hypothetical protein